MSWTEKLFTFAEDERVVLLALSVITFGAVSGLITSLRILRDENIVPPPEPKTQYITQDTEDALQLETLDKLLTHPTYPIREVSIKILCDRAFNDTGTLQHLLYGITRPDYDERMKCLRALALLTAQTSGM